MLLNELRQELEQLSKSGRVAEFATARRRAPGVIDIRGKQLVDFANWDLFNLNHTPAFKRVAQQSIEEFGVGAASPRLVSGSLEPLLAAEHRLSKFLGNEASVLFSSKNQAVLSLITALAGERDVIFADESVVSPVFDAAFLVGATAVPLKNVPPSALDAELSRAKAYRRAFLFIEQIQALSGFSSDLKTIVASAQRNGVSLIVDESCSLGVTGLRGAGAKEALGAELAAATPTVLGQLGDLSLAAASYGAFVSGSSLLVSLLVWRSKTFRSEAALPPAVGAAIEQAIDSIELKHAAREHLATLSRSLRAGLSKFGLHAPSSDASPIVCTAQRKLSEAIELSTALISRGFFAEALSKNAQLSEGATVRFIINAAHTEAQIEALLQAIADVAPKIAR